MNGGLLVSIYVVPPRSYHLCSYEVGANESRRIAHRGNTLTLIGSGVASSRSLVASTERHSLFQVPRDELPVDEGLVFTIDLDPGQVVIFDHVYDFAFSVFSAEGSIHVVDADSEASAHFLPGGQKVHQLDFDVVDQDNRPIRADHRESIFIDLGRQVEVLASGRNDCVTLNVAGGATLFGELIDSAKQVDVPVADDRFARFIRFTGTAVVDFVVGVRRSGRDVSVVGFFLHAVGFDNLFFESSIIHLVVPDKGDLAAASGEEGEEDCERESLRNAHVVS